MFISLSLFFVKTMWKPWLPSFRLATPDRNYNFVNELFISKVKYNVFALITLS